MRVINKFQMNTFFFNDPSTQKVERMLNSVKIEYFYFDNKLKIKTKQNQVVCGCLLIGSASLVHEGYLNDLNQFDLFYLPPGTNILIEAKEDFSSKTKLCLCYSPIEKEIKTNFEIQHYEPTKFIQRGELGSSSKMATNRTVWTGIMNGYFMAGFTSIPKEMLSQGVITSVNLEDNGNGEKKIFPHIHPDFPECYIFCIDDPTYAITQYIINSDGESICKDLTNGEGLFFPGNLGHCNFARPTNKKLNICQYLWIISTFGRVQSVTPITLRT